jgi:hypothetical protein
LTVSNYTISGLSWYWPIVSGSLNDYASGQNLTAIGGPGFMADRFGNANGALLRTSASSYWQAPDGVYFSGDFSVTGWVILRQSTWTDLRKISIKHS